MDVGPNRDIVGKMIKLDLMYSKGLIYRGWNKRRGPELTK